MTNPPAPRADLKWLAVDFDGTLFESNWSVDNPQALPGNPIWRNVAKSEKAAAAGWKIHIHTARPSSDYEIIEWALRRHNITFHGIHTGKLLAHRYIDDKAINAFEEEWV